MDQSNHIEDKIRKAISKDREPAHSPLFESAVRTHLYLALHCPDLEDYARLTVLVPGIVLGWEASVYIIEENGRAVLAASTDDERMKRLDPGQWDVVDLSLETESTDGNYRLPLHNSFPGMQKRRGLNLGPVIGVLELNPGRKLNGPELSFLKEYADMTAAGLVHRLIYKKSEQHLAFVKKLVADIGHNVIVPNIFFKAYLRRLSGKIRRLVDIQKNLDGLHQVNPGELTTLVRDLSEEMANANEGLVEEFDHIEKHYVNTSLFLETLLRQSHFEQGQYVLKKTKCNFRKDVIDPQVDQYQPKLKNKGIRIDLSAGGVPDQVIEAVVDVGLISQVFANLLSNAVKYTRTAPRPDEGKFISYGMELVSEAFGPGTEGVKINLFSSGRPLSSEEAADIFEEGRRGQNVEKERGTGHGLYFVKEVVELHGGRVGHEATPMGNNFYFILPK